MSCDGLCDDVLHSATIEMEENSSLSHVDLARLISSVSGGHIPVPVPIVQTVYGTLGSSNRKCTHRRVCIDHLNVLCTDPDTPANTGTDFGNTQ